MTFIAAALAAYVTWHESKLRESVRARCGAWISIQRTRVERRREKVAIRRSAVRWLSRYQEQLSYAQSNRGTGSTFDRANEIRQEGYKEILGQLKVFYPEITRVFRRHEGHMFAGQQIWAEVKLESPEMWRWAAAHGELQWVTNYEQFLGDVKSTRQFALLDGRALRQAERRWRLKNWRICNNIRPRGWWYMELNRLWFPEKM